MTPDLMRFDDAAARKNARILAFAMALAGANASVVFATAGLIGQILAPDPAFATAPITSFVLGTAFMTMPAAWLMRVLGRKDAYRIGAGLGVAAGLLAAYAMQARAFELFMLATALCGAYQAFVISYRFAAVDQASPDYRAKAISLVLLGGLASAIIGPQLVIHTKDLMPPILFLASYLAQAAVAGLSILVLSGLRAPPVLPVSGEVPARPLREIFRNSRLIVATICGAIAQALMNLIMTASPLAMVGCFHSVTDATLAIQWHIIGMYLPGFFTGALINRFGVYAVMIFGLVLLALCGVVALMGITVAHFFTALILLGLGWNFAFVGATTLVVEGQRPNERNKVQGFNDFIVFGITAIASLMSGKILAWYGWASLNLVIFPFVIGAAILVLWLARQPRPAMPG
jgi:MFS family permease